VERQKPPVRIIGRYAVYDAIASGGMATVHLGRLLGPVGFSRTVAIKRLHPQYATDPEFSSMFLDEARLAARIRHPHVVPTLDVVATEGELFLVMEYVSGESLSRLVRAARTKGEAVPLDIVVAIMSGVLQGLHAAHEAKNERGEPLGIVHRDVSPQNVLVGSDGQARVLDFGVAKAVGRVQTTREGQLKGKISYMAPEQLGGETLDRRSDVYSASVVLWEALTGERLFSADNEGAVIARVLEGVIEPPSRALARLGHLPKSASTRALAELDRVTLKGLAADRKNRFETAREMAFALEACVRPATSAQVGAWVEQTASGVLKERASHVAEIESASSAGIADVARVGSTPEAEVPTLAIGSNPSNPLPSNPSNPLPLPSNPSNPLPLPSNPSNPLPLSSDPSNVLPSSPSNPSQPLPVEVASQLSSVSAVSAADVGRRPSNRRPLVIGVLAGAIGVGAIVLLVRIATTPKPGAAASSPVTLPIGSALSVLHPSELESASASAATAAEPPSSASAPAPLASAPQPKPKIWVPPPKPNAACNPPYTWDAQGQKHYKPECL
jgi:serine/threonine protein kinase